MDTKLERTRQNESGFYCENCDCVLKDSASFQDHLNGKKHNKNIGILLKKFTDSTLEEVKEVLAKKKKEREEKAAGMDQWKTEEDEESSAMARLMGFSNFQTTKR